MVTCCDSPISPFTVSIDTPGVLPRNPVSECQTSTDRAPTPSQKLSHVGLFRSAVSTRAPTSNGSATSPTAATGPVPIPNAVMDSPDPDATASTNGVIYDTDAIDSPAYPSTVPSSMSRSTSRFMIDAGSTAATSEPHDRFCGLSAGCHFVVDSFGSEVRYRDADGPLDLVGVRLKGHFHTADWYTSVIQVEDILLSCDGVVVSHDAKLRVRRSNRR